jgi:hypothetical protein
MHLQILRVKDSRRRELCVAAEEHKSKTGGAAPVSAAEIAKAKEAQLAALASLKLWYNDWATTFRDAFGIRAQITLGVTALKRKKKAEVAEAEADPREE